MQPLATGAQRRPVNSKDWNLGALSPAVSIPTSYMTDLSALPVEMQNQIPDCGAEGGQETQGMMLGFRGSPAFLWKEIKKTDSIPPEDGTNMTAIFNTLKNVGIAPYGVVNEDTTVSLAQYTDPSVITPQMEAEASTKKIGGYAFLNTITMDTLKQAIYQNKAVLLCMEIGTEFWTPSWAEKDILPLRSPSSIVSGHFVTAYGYDENYIYFRNHWSTAWGRQGDGYFAANYIPYVLEAGTVVEPVSTAYQFNNNLSLGMTSADVYFLQKRLNENSLTQIATTGSGSPGNETYYFGSLTKAAVIKYQALESLPQTGYVGPLTRASLNK